MSTARPIHLFMPDGGEAGVITVCFGGDTARVEFRGRPYASWDVGEDTPMSQIHDALPGWHATVLHCDEVLTVFAERHPHYETLRTMLDPDGHTQPT